MAQVEKFLNEKSVKQILIVKDLSNHSKVFICIFLNLQHIPILHLVHQH